MNLYWLISKKSAGLSLFSQNVFLVFALFNISLAFPAAFLSARKDFFGSCDDVYLICIGQKLYWFVKYCSPFIYTSIAWVTVNERQARVSPCLTPLTISKDLDNSICRSKKKTKHPYLFQYKLSCRNELVPNIMDYCLLQFDALKFFFRVHLHGGVAT